MGLDKRGLITFLAHDRLSYGVGRGVDECGKEDFPLGIREALPRNLVGVELLHSLAELLGEVALALAYVVPVLVHKLHSLLLVSILFAAASGNFIIADVHRCAVPILLDDQGSIDLIVREFLLQAFIILSVGGPAVEHRVHRNMSVTLLVAILQELVKFAALSGVGGQGADDGISCLQFAVLLDKHIRILVNHVLEPVEALGVEFVAVGAARVLFGHFHFVKEATGIGVVELAFLARAPT